MPRHALKPSPTLARMLRTRREELGWSVREVTARSTEIGERIPPVTLLKIEAGTQEPGVRRFYALLRLYRLPLEVVPDLLELESLAAEAPKETDPEKLLARGRAHWEKGEIGPGLACLFALRQVAAAGRRSDPAVQRAVLAFAVAASSIGRVRLANHLLGDLLVSPPDPSLRLNVLVLAAVNWRDLGAPDAALAFLLQAEACDGASAPGVQAWIQHARANALLDAGQVAAAAAAIAAARTAYESAGDPVNAAHCLGVQVRILLAEGRAGEARDLAQQALDDAEQAGLKVVAVNRRIDLGRCLVELGQAREALGLLTEGLAHALLLRLRTAEFRAHYWLFRAWAAAGDREQARLEHALALHRLQSLDEVSHESRALRSSLTTGGDHETLYRPRRSRTRTR